MSDPKKRGRTNTEGDSRQGWNPENMEMKEWFTEQFDQMNRNMREVKCECESISDEMAQLSTAVNARIGNVEKRVETIENTVDKLKPTVEEQKTKLLSVERQMLLMKARALERNLIFQGIEITQDEVCMDEASRFIKEDLKIEDSENLMIEDAYRIGIKKRNSRAMLVKFLIKPDRDRVLRAGPMLEGTKYGVSEHFPIEIEERRRLLYPIRKEMKKDKNKKVRMELDDLFINNDLYKGPGSRYEEKDKEEETMEVEFLNDTIVRDQVKKNTNSSAQPLRINTTINEKTKERLQTFDDTFSLSTPRMRKSAADFMTTPITTPLQMDDVKPKKQNTKSAQKHEKIKTLKNKSQSSSKSKLFPVFEKLKAKRIARRISTPKLIEDDTESKSPDTETNEDTKSPTEEDTEKTQEATSTTNAQQPNSQIIETKN